MPPPELQRFAAALHDPSAAPPAGLVAPPGAVVAERFAVYRNNVYASLAGALAARYPVCRALVGEQCFGALARGYVRRHLPASPVLFQYGAEMSGFIENVLPPGQLPYLADVARLEAAWTDCWGAAEAPVLAAGTLAALEPEALLDAHFSCHPAARLVPSAHPIASIWEAHQAPSPDLSDLRWTPEVVLLTRPGPTVLLRRLGSGAATLASSLLSGLTLESAAGAALDCDSSFDLAVTLAGLAADGLFSGVDP
jgi:hypothetical protein